MKYLLLLSTVLASANHIAAAATIQGFQCNIHYDVNGEGHQLVAKAEPRGKYFVIDETIRLVSKKVQLYVYYDGKYSAINLTNEADAKYYNADAEVDPGKLFTLLVRARDLDPAVDQFNLSCRGK